MKTSKWFIAAIILFTHTLTFGHSSDVPPVSEEKYGYFLDKNHKTARIPFELHSNLILLYAKINDNDSLRFILDTGVSSIIITDPNVLRADKLRMTRKVNLTGAGEGNSISAHVAIDNRFSMGRLKANHQNIVILEQDFLRLSEYVGVPVHGIFGYEIFNNFVVTIDFAKKEILLMRPDKYRYKTSKGDKHPLIIEDTKPFTDAVTLFADGREHPIRVLIDTGAGHALLLNNTPKETFRLPEKVIRAQLGRGLNGVINGNLGRVDKMKLGRFELNNVVASFPDSIAFGSKIRAGAERQGNIGCELLRRFKVTFNYGERYMVLKPIKSRLREKFEHDMSGMEIRAEGRDLRSYIVNHIVTDSPAARAGLMEGDQLLFIDDHSASELNVSEIYKLMQRGDGKNVDLLVKRKGDIFLYPDHTAQNDLVLLAKLKPGHLERFIITEDGSHSLFSAQFKQQYHSLQGALNESEHIYINLGLRPALENGPVSVFEMGFGTGLNAFLAWKLADQLQKQVFYTSVEAYPVSLLEASQLNYEEATGEKGFMQLHQAPWGKEIAISPFFNLRKEITTLQDFKPDRFFDVIFYDAFDPQAQPELWTEEVFTKIAAQTRQGGVLVTYSSKGIVKRALAAAGFKVERHKGPGRKTHVLKAIKL